MEEQPIELDERELANNQRHFKQVVWKSLLGIFVPVGIHVGLVLVDPKAFGLYWPYTSGGIMIGLFFSIYVRVTQNRCPVCNVGLGKHIPSQSSPRCTKCGSKIV